jgi:hypothetical protein
MSKCLSANQKHDKGWCSSIMMVLHNEVKNQETISRQQRRAMSREATKKIKQLEKKLKQTALPVTFDNQTITQFGLFGYLEAFKHLIGWQQIVKEHLSVNRRHNAKYSATDLLETLVDSACLGIFRFSHMDVFERDSSYQQCKEIDQVADESTLRYFLRQMTPEVIDQLATINQHLLAQKFRLEGPREVWLDFDDSVVTVFGEQEESAVGYNPRYHGRRSYKVKVAFISGTGELVYSKLYDGKTASNGQFLEFLKETLATLNPNQIIVKGIRIDRGFFDEKLFAYLESQQIEYICKAKMSSNVRKIADYLEQSGDFTSISSHYAAAEISVPLPKWEKARRFVCIRETLKAKVTNENQIALDLPAYEYQAIVTSLDELTAEEIWHEYNQRANIENKIDELKVGFGVDQMSQHDFIRNQAFLLIKGIAYNLLNWFRLALLDEKACRYEVPTLRRIILNVPGNIVGKDRYRHIKLAPNEELMALVSIMKRKLEEVFVRVTSLPLPFIDIAA